jgi:hypothetical protein
MISNTTTMVATTASMTQSQTRDFFFFGCMEIVPFRLHSVSYLSAKVVFFALIVTSERELNKNCV